MKQTAVKWLYNEIKHIIPDDFLEKFEQADKMFEDQIKDAWFDGVTNWDSEKEVEDYINEIFKTE